MLDHSTLGRWIDSPNKPVWRGLFIRLSSLGKGSQQRSDVPLESRACVTLWQTHLPQVLQNWHFPQGAKSQGTYTFGFRHAESQTMAPLLAWEKDTYFMTKLQASLKMFSGDHDGRWTCSRKGLWWHTGREAVPAGVRPTKGSWGCTAQWVLNVK